MKNFFRLRKLFVRNSMTKSQFLVNEQLTRIKQYIMRKDLQITQFESIYKQFRLHLLQQEKELEEILGNDNLNIEENIYKRFIQFINEKYPKERELFHQFKSQMKFLDPVKKFPKARSLKRKIIYHAGFTNSGKTYEAIQRLKSAKNGTYLSPLRLLAVEIFNDLNKHGISCDLVTGQAIKKKPLSTHVSSTIEVANFSTIYEVSVIDEIQVNF